VRAPVVTALRRPTRFEVIPWRSVGLAKVDLCNHLMSVHLTCLYESQTRVDSSRDSILGRVGQRNQIMSGGSGSLDEHSNSRGSGASTLMADVDDEPTNAETVVCGIHRRHDETHHRTIVLHSQRSPG